MKKVTEKALRASIAHWKRNVREEDPNKTQVQASDCALCARFDQGPRRCTRNNGERCPIFAEAGETGCAGSPYRAASHLDSSWISETDNMGRDLFHSAAIGEVAFLESLLPGKSS